MRRVLPGLLAAVMLSGVEARTPTDEEMIWIVMIGMASNPEEVMEELRGSAISEGAATRVRNYCKDALEQMSVFAKKYTAELCALKGGKRGAIADQLEKMHKDEEALQANLVANLGVVLSAEEESEFRNWALERQSSTSIFGENALLELAYQVRTGSVEASPIVDRACEALESEKAMASGGSVSQLD